LPQDNADVVIVIDTDIGNLSAMCCVSIVDSEAKEGTSVATGHRTTQASLFRTSLVNRGRKAAEDLLWCREEDSGLVAAIQLGLPFA